MLKSSAWVGIVVTATACAPVRLGSGCGIDDETTDVPAPKAAVVNPLREARVRLYERPTRPDAHNTGPYDATALISTGELMIRDDGTVYENVDVKGDIWIDADDVTIRNFRIDATGELYGINVLDGHRGILLEDGEIHGMDGAAVLGLGYTARRLYIHDSSGDGMKAQGEAKGSTLVEHCFIEKLGKGEGAHADGNQTIDGANITFRYNSIDMPDEGAARWPGPPYKANAAFMLSGDISNFVIESNWLNGGTYTVYCYDNDAGVVVRNNVFGRDALYGANAPQKPCKEWTGNVWEDTGDPI